MVFDGRDGGMKIGWASDLLLIGLALIGLVAALVLVLVVLR